MAQITTHAQARVSKRRKQESAAPFNIHRAMMLIAFSLVGAGLLGHSFRPDDHLYEWLVVSGFSALFGKLSNGFGKPFPQLLGFEDKNGDGLPDECGHSCNPPGPPTSTEPDSPDSEEPDGEDSH